VLAWRECSGCDTCLVRERLVTSWIDGRGLLGLVSVVFPFWIAGVVERRITVPKNLSRLTIAQPRPSVADGLSGNQEAILPLDVMPRVAVPGKHYREVALRRIVLDAAEKIETLPLAHFRTFFGDIHCEAMFATTFAP
jgi:hypothetical protein